MAADNVLQITFLRVSAILKEAISKHNGNPESFYTFAIDLF